MYPTPSSTSCEAVKGKAGWFIGICSLVFPACLTSAAIRYTSKRNFGSEGSVTPNVWERSVGPRATRSTPSSAAISET